MIIKFKKKIIRAKYNRFYKLTAIKNNAVIIKINKLFTCYL